MDDNTIFNFIMDNAKKILYPEEWIKIDLQVSKSELFSMLIIDRHGEIIMSQIADYVQIPMSTATSIIDRLVKKGLVQRGRSETDRRIVTISLSDKGLKIVSDLKGQISKYTHLLDTTLTSEDKQFIMQLYTKIISAWNLDSTITKQENKNNNVKKINID